MPNWRKSCLSREMARYHAMLGVEIGVGFTVTAIMFALYANLSTEGRLKRRPLGLLG